MTVAAAGAASKTVGGTLTVNPQATSFATCSRNPVTTDANRNPDQNVAGYQVNRATASGAYGALIDATKKCYDATGLQVGTTYLVVIMAYDISENDSQTFR